MSLFEKRFKILLEAPGDVDDVADVADLPVDDLPVGDEVTSDQETIAAVDDVPTNPAVNYKKEMADEQMGQLKSYISEIEKFKDFLNGTENDSLQAKINGAECDTLFKEISRSETKKIARIAQDLSSLVESLKGYLLSHEDE